METKLAIEDPEFGPRLQEVRVLRPDEVEKVELLKKIRNIIEAATEISKELGGRLEKAMDDVAELVKLTHAYLPEDERIRLGIWPEGLDFKVLEEAELIQRFVIRQFRDDLVGYRIASVFQDRISPVNRRGRLGTQMRLPGKIRFFADVDAITTLDFQSWRFLSDKDRQRLVHHELEHLEVNDESQQLMLRSHDFEDFVSIFQTYGPTSDSQRFSGDSLTVIFGSDNPSQFDMLEEVS